MTHANKNSDSTVLLKSLKTISCVYSLPHWLFTILHNKLCFSNPSGFFIDDVSADSSAEFPDRVSLMEVRLQAQEDEITLLKSSLADALRRIRLHDQLLPILKQQLIAGE